MQAWRCYGRVFDKQQPTRICAAPRISNNLCQHMIVCFESSQIDRLRHLHYYIYADFATSRFGSSILQRHSEPVPLPCHLIEYTVAQTIIQSKRKAIRLGNHSRKDRFLTVVF